MIALFDLTMIMGKTLQIAFDYKEVLRRTQQRIRTEDLVKGQDDDRACAIIAEELRRYRAEFPDDTVKIFGTIDPWKGFIDK